MVENNINNDNDVKRWRGSYEMSSDARVLYDYLEKNLIDEKHDIVKYSDLSNCIKRDVQKEAISILKTARNNIEKQHNIMLEVVRSVGIKISTDYEGALDKNLRHVRKSSRRTTKKVGRALTVDKINASIAAKLSIHGALDLMTSPKVPKKLIDSVEANKLKELSTAETLKLFESK